MRVYTTLHSRKSYVPSINKKGIRGDPPVFDELQTNIYDQFSLIGTDVESETVNDFTFDGKQYKVSKLPPYDLNDPKGKNPNAILGVDNIGKLTRWLVLTRAIKREHAKEVSDFSQSFDVQPIQAYYLYKYLENKNIKCYVAPFEADAQLAYMYKTNVVQVVYTCDTDLIYYGVNHILFSITRKDFKGIMYYESQISEQSSSINNMDENKRLLFAITLGNDYCKGVPLYGYKKTWPKLVPFVVTRKENEYAVDWEKTIKDYLTLLVSSMKSKTAKYNMELLTEDAMRCVRVYLHQPVFDISTATLVDMQGNLVLTPDGYCDFGALNGPVDDILYCRIDPETGVKFPNLVI